jgi:hypothetical protein
MLGAGLVDGYLFVRLCLWSRYDEDAPSGDFEPGSADVTNVNISCACLNGRPDDSNPPRQRKSRNDLGLLTY